jgi:hypothetical protein
MVFSDGTVQYTAASTGSSGPTGPTGPAGSGGSGSSNANIITTTDITTNATYYPVFVGTINGNSSAYTSSTNFVVNPNTGRVGIGSSTPVQALDVAGIIKVANSGNTIYINPAFGGGVDPAVQSAANNLIFTTLNNERMRINSAGGVGINQTSPSATLDVNGPIRLTPTNLGSSNATVIGATYALNGTGASLFGWNYTNGGGELDLIINKDGGSPGGLNIYDWTSNVMTSIGTISGSSTQSQMSVGGSPQSASGYSWFTVNGPSSGTGSALSLALAGTEYFRIISTATSTILSTQTALPMLFYTNNTERARFDSSGNFGVGTNNPLNRFAAINTGIAGGPPLTSGSAADGNATVRFGYGSVVTDFGAFTNGNMWMQTRSNANYATNYNMVLQPNGGFVGIGQSSPSYLLDVGGNLRVTTSGYFGADGTNGYTFLAQGDATHTGYVAFYLPGGTRTGYLGYAASSGTLALWGDSGANVALVFGTVGVERGRFTPNGSFLLGTTSAYGTDAPGNMSVSVAAVIGSQLYVGNQVARNSETDLFFQTGGVSNFYWYNAGTAGQTLGLAYCNSGGSFVGTALSIDKTAGAATFSNTLTVSSTLNVGGTIQGNGKEMFTTTDSYLRINQNSSFSSGTWFGGVLVGTSFAAVGSNGGTTTSKVYISGTYNGNVNIKLDGDNAQVQVGANAAGSSALNTIGYNAYGGTGYYGFLTATNTYASATTPSKFFRLNSTGSIEIVNSTYGAVPFTFTDAGAFSATNNITAYASDRRLKKNITPITNAVEKIRSIGGYTFDWDMEETARWGFTPDNSHEHGVIAQEIQAVVPDAVARAPFDTSMEDPTASKSGQDYLTVRYEKLVPLLVQSIKDLDQDLAQERAARQCLELRVAQLEQMILTFTNNKD